MRFLLPSERNNRWGLSLFDDIDSFFAPFFNDFKEKPKHLKVDISEKDNNYILEMDVPGYDKKDISIEFDDGYLTVIAKKQEDKEDKSQSYIKKERRKASCSRSFYVGDIKEDSIKPTLDNGILKITFPKMEKKSTKKQIEIK